MADLLDQTVDAKKSYKAPEASSSKNGRKPTKVGDKALLPLIDQRLVEMQRLLQQIEENEQAEFEAVKRSGAVPRGSSSDSLLRYVTTADRQYYRALKELKALQQERRERESQQNGDSREES